MLPSLTCPMCSQIRAHDEGLHGWRKRASSSFDRSLRVLMSNSGATGQLQLHGPPPRLPFTNTALPISSQLHLLLSCVMTSLHFLIRGNIVNVWLLPCWIGYSRSPPPQLWWSTNPLSDNHSYIWLSDPSTTPPPAPSGYRRGHVTPLTRQQIGSMFQCSRGPLPCDTPQKDPLSHTWKTGWSHSLQGCLWHTISEALRNRMTCWSHGWLESKREAQEKRDIDQPHIEEDH